MLLQLGRRGALEVRQPRPSGPTVGAHRYSQTRMRDSSWSMSTGLVM